MAGPQLRVIGGAWALGIAVAVAPMPVVAAPGGASTTNGSASSDAAPGAAGTTGAANAPTASGMTAPGVASTTSGAANASVAPAAPRAGEVPMTPRAARSPAFANQDGWTTPRPGPGGTSASAAPPGERRWQIRQAPLAGAESSWGPPGGQMPEYAEIAEPQAAKGPPSRGTARIVSGAIVGSAGLGLAIAGIVGATTDMLGDRKRLSVPMIGVGVVASAIGWALFADGVLKRKKFMRWQAKGGEVALAPMLVPGRVVGASLGLRF